MGSLVHSQLSPYLEELDTLEMSQPRSKHLASKPPGQPLAAPPQGRAAHGSPPPPNLTSCSSGNSLCTPEPHWDFSTGSQALSEAGGMRTSMPYPVMRQRRAFSMLQPLLTSPSLPNTFSPSSSSLSKITSAATEMTRGIARSCSSWSIPMGYSPSMWDASRAGGTNLHGGALQFGSRLGQCSTGHRVGWGTAGVPPPPPGCQNGASAGPQPAAQPARLLVGNAGPSLTHIPSFGWRFLFFPSPGAPINIPEPADIRAGADPCDAGSGRSISHPSSCAHPSTPEPLPKARHRDAGKPAQLLWSEPETCCQKGPPRHPGPPHKASQRQAGTALLAPLPRRDVNPKTGEQATLLPSAPRKGVPCPNHPAG